jgi:hypothetical protein
MVPLTTNVNWQPSRVIRAVDSANTSTGCTRVVTDAGDAYCKPLGNRQGPCVLASEWVCVRLAKWFGLATIDAAIIELTDDATFPLPDHKGSKYHAGKGPCFITRATPGDKWDGSADRLTRLINPKDLSKLVVFDTWVTNRDRHHPDYSVRKPNIDNVYLADAPKQKLELVAMDHTHCFGLKGGDEITIKLVEKTYAVDLLVYGLFPEFKGFIDTSALDQACVKLGSAAQSDIDPIIAQVPKQWEVTAEAGAAWSAAILKRAKSLSADLKDKILQQVKA